VKYVLGIVSLLIIPFHRRGKAIHDFVASSLVFSDRKLLENARSG